MNREEFYEVVLDKLKERYEEGCEITINYVPKNNGIIRTAFVGITSSRRNPIGIYCLRSDECDGTTM